MVRHVHMIGIGGAGLSAIAQVLIERGDRVSGSDRQESETTTHLKTLGIPVFIGHAMDNLQGADLVLRSSAIQDDNVEVQAAWKLGIKVVKRQEFLSELTAGYRTIAVAGSHGKTTTTAMIAWVLTDLGQDPTYIIGSVSTNLQRNAHAGEGPDFVIEADEYDYMFLGLSPTIAVITNIEHDHPDIFPTPESFYAAFHSFTKMILPGGWLLACEDDPGARRLLQAENPFARLGYAIEKPDASLRAVNLRRNRRGGFTFDVKASTRKETGEPKSMAHIDLGVPGRHNVLNALAAFGVVHSLGLPGKAIAASLGKFSGTARRFEVVADTQGIVVVSDYAHHPTEIRATIAAARQRFPEYRLWAIWQPHTYSRVQALFDEFSTSFDQADQVIVTEIFPAREAEPAGGFSAKQIVLAMAHSQAAYAATLDAARDMLLEELQSGDAVLILSAGDADLLARQLEVALSARDPEQQKEAGG